MKIDRHDVVKLRGPLLISLSLLIGALFLTGWSWLATVEAKQNHRTAWLAQQQIEQQLQQLQADETELRAMSVVFQSLQKSGIAGPENRLAWTETLREIQQELQIPGMNYEFGRQMRLDPADSAADSFVSSPMQLKLHLLHEQDLLNFLTRLEAISNAIILLRSCKLSRLPSLEAVLPELAAECELQWLTLHSPDAKP